MKKYYRVIKDTFIWKTGAILTIEGSPNGSANGYTAIEDIWDAVPVEKEWISPSIIEHSGNSEFFERVYPDNITGKLYKTKDQLLEMYNVAFK